MRRYASMLLTPCFTPLPIDTPLSAAAFQMPPAIAHASPLITSRIFDSCHTPCRFFIARHAALPCYCRFFHADILPPFACAISCCYAIDVYAMLMLITCC